ncbi:MAG TPA: DUF6268 family outer membrane beta-barrel protein [Chlamydiales bacterium]|nr:DUF6268 family outer membrane beta-barrel protein [Chlamydiales bacterium]
MKPFSKAILLFGLSVQCGALFSETDNFTMSLPSQSCTGWDKNFNIVGDYHHIQDASIQHGKFRHHDFGFREGKVLANGVYHFDKEKHLSLGIGYMNSHLDFDKRPHIRDSTFENLLVTAGTTVKSSDGWHWNGQLALQLNTDDISSRYCFFSGILEGKYEWKRRSNLHIGLIGVSGLRYTRVLPILGIDFKQSEQWKFNLIFPTNISAVYSFNHNFSLEAGLRTFLSRQRFSKHEEGRYERGFIAYRNLGAELTFNYKIHERLQASLQVGETLGGRIRLSNKHDTQRRHLKLKPSPYVGLQACLAF